MVRNIFQEWINPLLTWNASDFGDIDEINVDASKVWVPDIVLYNRYCFEICHIQSKRDKINAPVTEYVVSD